MTLRTAPGIAEADDFYAELIALHRGLDDAASRLLDARLILLLANHIGDLGVLREAMAAAREGLDPPLPPAGEGRGEGKF